MRYFTKIIVATIALFVVQSSAAQYYSWGSDAPQKWSTLKKDGTRVVYPHTASDLAYRSLYYIDNIKPYISYGLQSAPMKMPFVLHAENFGSNGMVMFMPRRVEFLTTPDIDNHSTLWLKHLAAHEYRHAAQYGVLRRGIMGKVSILLGQQAKTVGLLLIPQWMLEGDAVVAETMMTTYGRGLQPSFTMGYRAIGNVGEGTRGRDREKWFAGSYKEYIPDHYQLGYQMASYAYENYGDDWWDRVALYSMRNPYLLATTTLGLKKYYNSSTTQLFHETFAELNELWRESSNIANSSTPLVDMPQGNYTTYSHPMHINDSTLVALKSDFARSSRFIKLDLISGEERVIAYTGSVSSRPSYANGRLWWTEYRRSPLFAQRVASQLCYMDLSDGKPRRLRGQKQTLYPTPVDGGIAWVEYAADGTYKIKIEGGKEVKGSDGVKGSEAEVTDYPTPNGAEIHALAWDDATKALYTIVTDDSGMWLGRATASGVEPLTDGAFITISNLRAKGGKLYFGSIASGKDEAHCFDIATGEEWQISRSRYGSFFPEPTAGGVLLSSYDRAGYRLSYQSEDSVKIAVAPSHTPKNILNPKRRRWDVINIDTLRFDSVDSIKQSASTSNKRYRKGLNMFNVHSWLPLHMTSLDDIKELRLRPNIGATIISQNLLSNTESYASYGWDTDEGSLWNMGLSYSGLGVVLDFEAAYGGTQQFYAISTYDKQNDSYIGQTIPKPDRYYSFDISATLPIYLQRGYRTHLLSLSTAWNYSNGMVADLGDILYDIDGRVANIEDVGFNEGLNKLAFGVGFTSQVQLAYRDFLPRWAYTLSGSYSLDPTNRDFSDLLSLYGHIYTPGFAPHNSLSLALSYQNSLGGYRTPGNDLNLLSYKSSSLIPRGFSSADILSNNYVSASLNYQLPIAYPDRGIGSLIYFKRIRLNVGGDVAQWRYPAPRSTATESIWSAGGDLVIDFNLMRVPHAGSSSFKFSTYYTSIGEMWYGVSLGLPF